MGLSSMWWTVRLETRLLAIKVQYICDTCGFDGPGDEHDPRRGEQLRVKAG